MGKFFKTLLFLLLIGICIYGYINYKYALPDALPPEKQVTNDVSDLQKTINDLQNTVNKYKLEEKQEELRKIRLQQLQRPEIIAEELQNINELIVFEGVVTYTDYIKEGNWLANKSLDVELTYNFGIVFDLHMVQIRFSGETPILTIPKSEVKLKYVELDSENSQINGKKSWLSKQFVPEDIEGIIELAQESVTEKVNGDKDTYDKALVSLKENLRELVLKLGYEDCVIEEN